MKLPYRGTNPNTGVLNYEILGPTLILEVQHSRHRYVYGPAAPGAHHVAKMIELARAGKCLSTYIAQHVHSYQAKLPLTHSEEAPEHVSSPRIVRE